MRRAAMAADCTNCTRTDGVGDGDAWKHELGAELPEPDPDLFLLAGVAAGSASPREARAHRARAELQAALAERNRVRR